MHIRRTIVPLTVAASLGLAACGGGRDDSGLARADLAAKADSICVKAQADAEAVPAPEDLADAGQAAAYFNEIGPITHRETLDLAELEPAKGVKRDWEAFLKKHRAADGLVQTIKRKANAQDPSGQQDLAKIDAYGEAVTTAAKTVGTKKCAQ